MQPPLLFSVTFSVTFSVCLLCLLVRVALQMKLRSLRNQPPRLCRIAVFSIQTDSNQRSSQHFPSPLRALISSKYSNKHHRHPSNCCEEGYWDNTKADRRSKKRAYQWVHTICSFTKPPYLSRPRILSLASTKLLFHRSPCPGANCLVFTQMAPTL